MKNGMNRLNTKIYDIMDEADAIRFICCNAACVPTQEFRDTVKSFADVLLGYASDLYSIIDEVWNDARGDGH